MSWRNISNARYFVNEPWNLVTVDPASAFPLFLPCWSQAPGLAWLTCFSTYMNPLLSVKKKKKSQIPEVQNARNSIVFPSCYPSKKKVRSKEENRACAGIVTLVSILAVTHNCSVFLLVKHLLIVIMPSLSLSSVPWAHLLQIDIILIQMVNNHLTFIVCVWVILSLLLRYMKHYF